MSSAKSKASWIIMAIVEGMKDQGYARWNYPIRSLYQHTKNNIRSYAVSSKAVSRKIRDDKLKQSEESLRTVMYLSSWGPN